MTRRYSAILILLLTWLPAAVFAQTISSFSPASGNVGALVTLSGTNLNLVTAVAVNGTACVILEKTGTSLRLLVLPGATSGPITATGGAPAASATAFTVTRTALNTAQQGPKLIGTGALGRASQGIGIALSADGNTLAVGGHGDNDTGATWVFTRSGMIWSQQGPKLVGTGVRTGTGQGHAIALSADGNTLAVGGYNDNGTGATWVFTRSGTVWSQQGPKLFGTGAVRTPGNLTVPVYAMALSADGNTLAMGEFHDNSGTGATWVFTRSGTVWSQQGSKLVGTGARPGLVQQGTAVALSADGNTLAVGGPHDNGIGATWIFTRSGTSWSQQGPKLVGTGVAGPYVTTQGCAVALSADGHTLAVGGFNDDNSALGATWVFTRSGTSWSQQGPKLVGTGAMGMGIFQGCAVALSADGNTLAVGGRGDNANAGATWIFTRSGTVWNQQGPKVIGTGAVLDTSQGTSLALSADGMTLAVGGPSDNSEAGATWVFSTAGSPLAQRAAAGPRVRASFFPNPVTEQLTVTGGASSGPLRLFDSTGHLLLTAIYHNGQPLDLSALPAGLYWLVLDQAPARPLLKR